MYFDFDKLAKNELTRELQLRALISIQAIFELVLEVPCLIDLDRFEKRLIDDYYSLLDNIYHPNKL